MKTFEYKIVIIVSCEDEKEVKSQLDETIYRLLDNANFISQKDELFISSRIKKIK